MWEENSIFETRLQDCLEGNCFLSEEQLVLEWTDECLEHSFGNVGPIKYKIGDCIKKKKIDVPETVWCM